MQTLSNLLAYGHLLLIFIDLISKYIESLQELY